MKIGRILRSVGIVILLTGCSGNRPGSSIFAVTTVPTQSIEQISSETSVPTQQIETTPSASLPNIIQVPTYPPETRMQAQCLDVEATPISEIGSSGILVLENRASLDEGHYKPGTFQLNMRSGQLTEISEPGENQIDHVVSPNRSLLAYENVIFNSEGKVAKEELVIADATGNRLKTIPWEEEWWQTPIWSDNEHVVINLSLPGEENSDPKPLPMLVLNPFTNERRIIKSDFSGFPVTSSADLPYWEGRWGTIYDPTLTYVVYPRTVENNDEMYTYAVWDLSQRRLVTTLDEIFSSFLLTGNFPIPKWSPDGSRFVFQGFDPTTDPVNIEMYEVNHDGQTKQLTQLAPVAYVWESSFSWSPDGRYIAMSLAPHLGAFYDKARVAVLDTVTLNIIDYCVSVTFSGDGYGRPGPSAPIWSPNSHQFVITDWYEKDHRRLILIDIEKNSAVHIADDIEPVGWMASPWP
jgi:hypothetical protein